MNKTSNRYDPALLIAAQSGDQQAIELLLKIVQPDIRRYAFANCKMSDVNDAVQEVLWLIYRKFNLLRSIDAFSSWMFVIVRRECWRLAKTFHLHFTELDDAELNEYILFLPQEELRHDLAKAIESLPDHYREIILLRDIEEMTIDEISCQLGQTRESVKAKLHRARLLLREYLRD